MFDSILVVCIGNICRSPMGEILLRAALPDRNVSSAGIAALVGHPADPLTLAVLPEQCAQLEAHRARQLTSSLCRSADLILVMETAHKRAVESIDASARGKIYRWGEWGGFDVPDPYRRPQLAFEQALTLIRQGLELWLPKIKG